ncbi:hypothetical protein [Mycobacterium paragordonae]|uniref:Head-to-tail stopper n=1 Tax=Mycobacterium paragordonae TaxID=1389713 RepID=A0AAJ1S4W5_9MYCO|nr:hypothetical protein [Mycobacterium paragordonae]MDP7733643.1 hypothetical protein [Mycobacterium paragordonae]
MSLLDRGPCYEPCEVYLEELVEDIDGNPRTRASSTPTPAKARFQIQWQSGTSSRRQEQDNEGFESEKIYMVRFPRSFPHPIGAQSKIKWRGEMWSVFGDANRYNSSPRTAHDVYTIKRY